MAASTTNIDWVDIGNAPTTRIQEDGFIVPYTNPSPSWDVFSSENPGWDPGTLPGTPLVNDIQRAFYDTIMFSRIRGREEEAYEEIHTHMYAAPNKAYIYNRWRIFMELNRLIKDRMSGEERNSASFTQGLERVRTFITTHNDAQIQEKINEHGEVQLFQEVYNDGNGKKLEGVKCMIAGGMGGHEGIILAVEEGKNSLRDDIVKIDAFSQGVVTVPILSFVVDRKNFPPELVQIKNLIFGDVTREIQKRKNEDIESVDRLIAQAEKDKQIYEERLKETQFKLDEYIQKKKNTTNTTFTIEDLKRELKLVKTHTKVDKAFIGSDGSINIVTKPLYYVQGGKEKKRKNLGRYHIYINYIKGSWYVKNTTYAIYRDDEYYDEEDDEYEEEERIYYYHMNIDRDGNVCQGTSSHNLYNLFTRSDTYYMVDYLIEFLSLEHDEDANPYISANEFLKEKEKLHEEYIFPEEVKL